MRVLESNLTLEINRAVQSATIPKDNSGLWSRRDGSRLTLEKVLVGTALRSIPEPDLFGVPTNRLSLWQVIQRKSNQCCKLWATDNLHLTFTSSSTSIICTGSRTFWSAS